VRFHYKPVRALLTHKAKSANCHASSLFEDNMMHTSNEIGIDDFEAKGSPTGKYRTTPLGGLLTKTKAGFYHDGRFATLNDVVNHYNNHLSSNLSSQKERLS
jgi:cytochrome c peroxidase